MFGISAVASNDVWAVGYVGAVGGTLPSITTAPVARGRSPSPGNGENALLGVTALASNDVWAVSFFVTAANQDRPRRRSSSTGMAPNGRSVPSPNVGGNNSQTISNELRGVIAVSANDVWAFGDTDAFGPEQITNLVMHWDGTKWSIIPTPDPNPRHQKLIDDVIAAGVVVPQGNLYLVGVADGFGSMVLNATGQ